MTTLHDALQVAHAYWEAKGPSSRMMSIRANACAQVAGMKTPLAKLGAAEATKVLTHLHKTKSKGSVLVYYAAFKRAVEMGGGDTRGWPKAGSAPRKCREPLSEADLDRLGGELRGYSYIHGEDRAYLERHGYHILSSGHGAMGGGHMVRGTGWETYDLLELLRGTGMRVDVEALSWDAWTWDPEAKVLRITGKGGHERRIPVERPQTIELLNSPARLKKLRNLSYSGHLKRWTAVVDRLRIKSMKPTPHAVRHYYATRAYEKSGRNLRVVQELLGHADISTTARYLGVDVEELRRAVA